LDDLVRRRRASFAEVARGPEREEAEPAVWLEGHAGVRARALHAAGDGGAVSAAEHGVGRGRLRVVARGTGTGRLDDLAARMVARAHVARTATAGGEHEEHDTERDAEAG